MQIVPDEGVWLTQNSTIENGRPALEPNETEPIRDRLPYPDRTVTILKQRQCFTRAGSESNGRDPIPPK